MDPAPRTRALPRPRGPVVADVPTTVGLAGPGTAAAVVAVILLGHTVTSVRTYLQADRPER